MKQITFNVFNNRQIKFTENDIDQIIAIIAKRCGKRNVANLSYSLGHSAIMIPDCEALDSLVKENGKWRYIAGQSCAKEFRLIRKTIVDHI